MAEPGARNTRCDEPAPFGQQIAGAIMSKFQQSLKVLAVVIGIGTLSACQSLNPNVPVAKSDNGLGDLPHYRDWIDPTGRSPMGPVMTANDSTRWP
jgi:hypothetical protein